MKMKRKLRLIILGAVASLCFGIGIGNLSTNVASADNLDFYVRGASVRLADTAEEAGIRFSVVMEKTKYEQAVAADNVEMGVYLIPHDMLVDINADGWDVTDFTKAEKGITYSSATETDVEVNKWFESVDVPGYMESLVYLYDIPSGSYNRPISAVAYLNNEFTGNVERSFSQVALAAVEAGEVTEQDVSAYLSQEYTVEFIDDGTLTGTAGQVLSSAKYTYGKEFVAPEVPTVFGKTFLGVYSRIGTKDGNPVWSDEFYDVTQPDAMKVLGNMQFKLAWGDYIEYAGTGKSGAYQFGAFTVAETDYAEGTYVNVTLKIKMSGSIFEAKSLWTRYLSEADTWTQLTAPNTAALETYKDFAEVTFKAYVPAGGNIQLEVRNSSGLAGDYCVQVKDVVVAPYEEIIEYSGTGKANAYQIGTFTIAETDYAEGTYVNVTLKIKLSGAMFESKSLWTRYLSGADTWTQLTAPNTAALETYKDFAEVTFKAYVPADGKIQLEVRNSSGKSAAYCVEVKNVLVEPVV